jgi:AcrR family transcriptional regulator
MSVSGQALETEESPLRGPRARMRRLMLDTALRLMQRGITPSVSDVAEAAEVSRATAYRYFPSHAAMIQAVVDEALGPILGWSSELDAAEERVADLVAFAYPRILDYEATHRAALLLALDQWARRQAGTIGTEERVVRGNRRGLLKKALAPLEGKLSRQAFDKVAQSLSLIFGIEAIVVLKDIWGLDDDEARQVAGWAAHALVRTALAEAGGSNRFEQTKKRKAAARPRKAANGHG